MLILKKKPKPFYSLPITKYCRICLQIPSKVKVALGKIIPVALKSPQAYGSDLAPLKYPMGVTDCSSKYFY
jgi:hypothetical protein